MIPGLIAVGLFAGFLLVMAVVARRRGARAHFIESWVFEPGEVVVWRDDRADVMVVPRMGRAVVMSPARLHRSVVVATDRRVIVATKTFGGRGMVTQVLERGAVPEEAGGLSGGLFRVGYETQRVLPGAVLHEGRRPGGRYVALTLDPAVASSFNVAEIRVYSESAGEFPGIG